MKFELDEDKMESEKCRYCKKPIEYGLSFLSKEWDSYYHLYCLIKKIKNELYNENHLEPETEIFLSELLHLLKNDFHKKFKEN